MPADDRKMKRCLIVVDMLKGFCEEGKPLYVGERVKEIIPFVAKRVKEYAGNNEPIIFLVDSHEPADEEFKMFPPHCVRGTEETQIIDELRTIAGDYRVVYKSRYSGFFRTTLERELAELKPDVVEVVGVYTNICVLFTVEDLRNLNYRVVVPRKGVASCDEGAHEFALIQMESVLGAEVM